MASEASGKNGTPGSRSSRDERRAAALRDNLRRRKMQARGRADHRAEAPADVSSPDDQGPVGGGSSNDK